MEIEQIDATSKIRAVSGLFWRDLVLGSQTVSGRPAGLLVE